MEKRELYQRLYTWWEQNKRILPWRETQDGYCIWLSEVILQQTRVAQGLDYYLEFVRRWPTVQDLAQASEDEVMRVWQGLGYYSRARNLLKAAQQIVATAPSSPEGKVVFPTSYEQLRQLPGVGDYTAGAIASFAYNLPYPALDGNVYRVLARLSDCDIAFDTAQGKKHFHALAERLIDPDHPRLFNSALMELGALQCTPSLVTEDGQEACEDCPLADDCLARAHHTAAWLPVRKARLKPKDREMVWVVYLDKEKRTLLHQRGEGDIWAKLFEFVPITDGALPPSSKLLWEGTHVLSHLKIRARFWVCACEELPKIQGTIAVPWIQLDEYALARLTLKAISRHI